MNTFESLTTAVRILLQEVVTLLLKLSADFQNATVI